MYPPAGGPWGKGMDRIHAHLGVEGAPPWTIGLGRDTQKKQEGKEAWEICTHLQDRGHPIAGVLLCYRGIATS